MSDGFAVDYGYDLWDRRIGKEVDSDGDGIQDEAWTWVYDGQHAVLQLHDADGDGSGDFALTNRYLYGDAVDMILADEQLPGAVPMGTAINQEGDTYWPLGDHLGSIRDVADSAGVVRQHVVYDSFGRRLAKQHYDSSGAPVSASHAEAIDHLFGFTGRDWDADVDLQYNRARWYDPALGRWLSQDPIGFRAGDVNLYRYVGNEATSKTDPSGLEEAHPASPPYDGPSIGPAPNPTPWWKVPFIRDPRSPDELQSPGAYHWVVGNLYWRLGAADAVGGVRAVYDDPAGTLYNCTIGVPGNIYHMIIHWDDIPDLAKQDIPAKIAAGLVTGNVIGIFPRVNVASRLGDDIKSWLGPNSRAIVNPAGDWIFISEGGTRRVRFDINRPHPHQNPHCHVEAKIDGKWIKSGPIYPKDVTPH